MRVDQIEIHAGGTDFDYESVRQLEAKCEAKTAFSKAPTIEDVNLKLQEMAAGIGADAVVNVTYDSGVSMTSWRSMKAKGLAVRKVSNEIACPVCAEQIKRAATKCRFCGTEFHSSAASAASTPAAQPPQSATQPWAGGSAVTSRPSHRAMTEPPLRSTDNPQWVLWLIFGFAALITVISILSS